MPPGRFGVEGMQHELFDVAEIGRDSAQMSGFELPFDDTLVKNPPFCPVTIAFDCATRVSVGLGRGLQLPHLDVVASTADHPRQAVIGVHKVGFSAPARPNSIAAEDIVLRGRISSQLVFVHEVHSSELAGGDGEVRHRSGLVGQNQSLRQNRNLCLLRRGWPGSME